MRGPQRGPTVRQSKRPIGGRRFEPLEERRLHPLARNAIGSLPGAREDVIVVAEAAGPFGMPDFLALVGGRASVVARRRIGVPPLLNSIDTDLVAAAGPVRALTFETLVRRSGVPEGTARRRLPALVRRGALIKISEDRWTRPAALQPMGRLYAIELKLKDWQRALRQCRRYHLWADSYVLVLSHLPESAIDAAVNAVERDGGGLVTIEGVLRRPRVRPHAPGRRLLASEYFFASL